MARYRVEMKRFKDGTWYTKTETDNLGAAVSVAVNCSKGREYNVIETETGDILRHDEEDDGMKRLMCSKDNPFLLYK